MMTNEDYDALPFAQVEVTHGFPDPRDRRVFVSVDGRPVARLAATKVGFDQNYSSGFGHVTLELIAGDCQVLSSRPKLSPPQERSPDA